MLPRLRGGRKRRARGCAPRSPHRRQLPAHADVPLPHLRDDDGQRPRRRRADERGVLLRRHRHAHGFKALERRTCLVHGCRGCGCGGRPARGRCAGHSTAAPVDARGHVGDGGVRAAAAVAGRVLARRHGHVVDVVLALPRHGCKRKGGLVGGRPALVAAREGLAAPRRGDEDGFAQRLRVRSAPDGRHQGGRRRGQREGGVERESVVAQGGGLPGVHGGKGRPRHRPAAARQQRGRQQQHPPPPRAWDGHGAGHRVPGVWNWKRARAPDAPELREKMKMTLVRRRGPPPLSFLRIQSLTQF